MIDASSTEGLTESLPRTPKTVQAVLQLKMLTPKAIRSAIRPLARRGYGACLPLARTRGKDYVVLRALPDAGLDLCPIAVVWPLPWEPTTFSPSLKYLVAGRMALLDVADPTDSVAANVVEELLGFAAEFGDRSSVERVLATVPEASTLQQGRLRQSKLWSAACPSEPLCRVIAGAYSHKGTQVGALLGLLDDAARATDIGRRLFVTYHAKNRTGVDITREAWRLIEGDNVFDTTYTGLTYGPARGVKDDAHSYAVRALVEKGFSPEPRNMVLWEAALARERKCCYDGSLHLGAAKEFALCDPALAFRQASNAAVFFYRSTRRPPKDAIGFAHELAEQQQWSTIATLLGWAREELKV